MVNMKSSLASPCRVTGEARLSASSSVEIRHADQGMHVVRLSIVAAQRVSVPEVGHVAVHHRHHGSDESNADCPLGLHRRTTEVIECRPLQRE